MTKENFDWPYITVWVAARNEEKAILNCLKKLNDLDYPKNRIQILIGNDQSTDNTSSIVTEYIKDKSIFELIFIDKIINNQKGKANVLANLYEESTGKYFLISDADVNVNKHWAKGMISNFQNNSKIGHQVGITSIFAGSHFAAFQAVDWLFALTLLKIAAYFNIPITGLGNNSAITREAYESVGGYAQIPFSITEDFALFHAVVKQNFLFNNAINPNVFAKTTSMDSIKEFLHQRKRWMIGAMQCPWWIVIFLFIQALFPFILLIISIVICFKIAIFICIAKIILQSLLITPTLIILHEQRLFKYLLPFEFYSWLWGLSMIIFYFLPINIDWKGRIYTNN